MPRKALQLLTLLATTAGATPVVDLDFADGPAHGPRPPTHSDFSESNQAAHFTGTNPLVLPDVEHGGPTDLKFRAGETITLEAWVKIDTIGAAHMTYLLGKGRHAKNAAPGCESSHNQNYALRLQGTGANRAQLGFLFASRQPETGAQNWHRWWSTRTLGNNGGWNHVAVSYTFGKKGSLRAVINGRETSGTWDMGGDTDLPPIADPDHLVVGTGFNRSSKESFHGWLDDVRIHRGSVPVETLLSRFEYTPPPPPITPEMVEPGTVLVQISEQGVPQANAWPDQPIVTESYHATALGFSTWPQKYITTGVRADRPIPTHFRASAKIQLPAGKHRLLLRGRGATHLSIDGQLVLENPFPPSSTDGHNLVSEQDDYLDLGPTFRFVPPGNRESWTHFESDGKTHFVVLESMIGALVGKAQRRPEFGETVAAISPEGSDHWFLLTPTGLTEIPYTDDGWATYDATYRQHIAGLDSKNRAARRAGHAGYWASRRQAVKSWLAKSDPTPVPDLPPGFPANNEIDHFIAHRIKQTSTQAAAATNSTIDYFEHVQPLLEANCYSCHQGGKVKGDLRLDNRSSALDSAILPGDPGASPLIERIGHDAGDDIMPPKGDPLTPGQIATLTTWIAEGAHWPAFEVTSFQPTAPADDLTFLRRAALDTVGVPPTEAEIARFLADPPTTRRTAAVDRFLADPRWADNWMGYWQDVLAENPNIINPTLNNTGPFRWWIHESLLDNKPLDLFVTELIRMEGSDRFGGPRGFATASNNDVPMAAKGIIVASAFLGVEMKCARCHDAPAHEWKQQDLFQLAAMLKKQPVSVPETSSVPMDKLHDRGRKPLIEVTLKPGASVKPAWPFPQFADPHNALPLAQQADNPRDQLAALITAPSNQRFAQVMANRIWHRLMGRGIVATVADWEKGTATHPKLLAWLGRQLTASGYDTKSLARLIMNSHAYGRATDSTLAETSPLYVAPAPRRLAAEQIADSLFAATGTPFDLEELSLDIDGGRTLNNSISLGVPRRAWMLASTSNERDRPSLSLPKIQAVSSFLETFGWRGARQDPVTVRESEPNVLQPAVAANGTMATWLTRLSDDHGITQLALQDQPVELLVDRLFLRLLTRHPTPEEKSRYTNFLKPGYTERLTPHTEHEAKPHTYQPYVSWSNHLDPAANVIAKTRDTQARQGKPPTTALTEDWRLRLEDLLWALLNSPELIYLN